MKMVSKVLLTAAAIAALAAPAMAADKLIVKDTGGNNIFVVTDDGMFGFNTATPSTGAMQIKANKLATHNDVLGGTAAAGVGVDIDTGTGTAPSGALQAASFSMLARYPAATVSNNFNVFRMIARTDPSTTGNFTGQFSAANFMAQHQGAGTASLMVGFITNVAVRGTGNITNAKAVVAASPTRLSTGSITNAYGINILAQKVTGVTNGYAIYQEGTTDTNYLAAATNQFPNLPVFADNTAAASLAAGTLYRTATGVVMVKY